MIISSITNLSVDFHVVHVLLKCEKDVRFYLDLLFEEELWEEKSIFIQEEIKA